MQTASCPTCAGSGRIFTPETVVRRIERAVRRVRAEGKERSMIVRVHPEVALYILEQEPGFLRRVERENQLALTLRDDPLMYQDRFRLLSAVSNQDFTQRFAVG
jgi:ribonuclease G